MNVVATQAQVIAGLQAQVSAQAETIRLLRAVLDDISMVPADWGLTRRQSQIFMLLLRREYQDGEAIVSAIFTSVGADEIDPNTIQSYVHHLRRKLAPIGVQIVTHRGYGYHLVDRQRWREQLQVRP